jgi:hypothetical protein
MWKLLEEMNRMLGTNHTFKFPLLRKKLTNLLRFLLQMFLLPHPLLFAI